MTNSRYRNSRNTRRRAKYESTSPAKLVHSTSEDSPEDRKIGEIALRKAIYSLNQQLRHSPLKLKIATFMLEDALERTISGSSRRTVLASADGQTRRRFVAVSISDDTIVPKAIGAAYGAFRAQLDRLTS